MSKKTKVAIVTTLLTSSVLLGGCGLLGNKTKEIDPPQKETVVEGTANLEKETVSKKEDEAQKMVMTELYLIDKNGYVVPKSISLPNSTGVAKQALQYLVDNGPVANILPNDFRAVIPADTEVGVDINKEGVATVDFSPEFAKYKAEDELKILQAITWTITQFDSVKSVKLQMNGHELNEMPVNKTPISSSLNRSSGINLDTTNVTDITNTIPLTVYYLGGNEKNYYYVPVTKRVSVMDNDVVAAVIEELAEGPSITSKLQTEFMPELALIDKPKLSEGKVALNFNENIYSSFEDKVVSKRLLDALVLSLTEQADIKSVEVLVNGEANVKLEGGKDLTAPVSRPEKVNSTSL